MTSFSNLWKEEVCMQLLSKGSQLIKDAKVLDPVAYSEFIVLLLSSRKNI